MHVFDFMWFMRFSSQKTEWANWILHELLMTKKYNELAINGQYGQKAYTRFQMVWLKLYVCHKFFQVDFWWLLFNSWWSLPRCLPTTYSFLLLSILCHFVIMETLTMFLSCWMMEEWRCTDLKVRVSVSMYQCENMRRKFCVKSHLLWIHWCMLILVWFNNMHLLFSLWKTLTPRRKVSN